MKKFKNHLKRLFTANKPVNKNAIVVLGKEKCGTTAIAALLAKRTARSVTLDIPPIWNQAETRIRFGKQTLETFIQKHSSYFATDFIKEPCLTFMAEQVFEFFPNQKSVFIVRDPRDNIRSIFNRLGFPGNEAQPPKELVDSIPSGWETVIDPVWNNSPSDHYIDVQAHRWNWATEVIDKNDDLVIIRYEDFILDKTAAIDKLANELQLEVSVDITDDLEKQFQPKGNQKISSLDFFGRENLARIVSICGKFMERLGYQVD